MRIRSRGLCKKAAAAILSMVMVFGCFTGTAAITADAKSSDNTPPAYVTNSSSKGLWAQCLNTETSKNIEATKWFEKNGKYYWFLPSSANLESLTVYHNYTNVTINGTAVANGSTVNFLQNNKDYTVVADGKTVTLAVQKADGIGSMFITTASGSMDYIHQSKDNSESGNMVMVDYDGTVSYDNGLDTIKGRGNTTWTNIAKKPYNIKLSKKASLLGMAKSKRWCLLANGQEHSMIRNRFMYDLANDAGLDYAPDSRFVDLYANGEYLGTYQLTQKVELGADNLVDITDLESNTEDAVMAATGASKVDLTSYSKYNQNKRTGYNIPYDPSDITGGYLMEYVWGVSEPSGFVTSRNQNVDVKSPEACSAAQINYIADFVQDMEDAIYSTTGYNKKGKYYTDYIDTQSAAIMYLLQEFSVNIDGGISSCFFYKDSDLTGDGKVHASPCWDFDVALGNLTNTKDGVKMTSYNQWFQKNAYLSNTKGVRTIFGQLCQHSDFNEAVTSIWNESFVPAFNVAFGNAEQTGRLKSLKALGDEVESSSVMNYTRWNLTDNLLVADEGTTHQSNYNYLVKWIQNRYNFMNPAYANLSTAKADAKKQIDDKMTEYKSQGYSADIIANMQKAADDGKTQIDAATTTAAVGTLLDTTLKNMASYIVAKVYFDNNLTDWSSVYAYTWGGSSSMNWPGVQATNEGGGIYSYTVPNGVTNIIFNNGKLDGQGKSQTLDLTVPGNNYIYKVDPSSLTEYPERNGSVYDSGEWSKYTAGPEKIIYGDANGDKAVDTKDAVLINKYIAKYFVTIQFVQADVDGDGKITLKDAVYVQKYLAKLITKFPIENAA